MQISSFICSQDDASTCHNHVFYIYFCLSGFFSNYSYFCLLLFIFLWCSPACPLLWPKLKLQHSNKSIASSFLPFLKKKRKQNKTKQQQKKGILIFFLRREGQSLLLYGSQVDYFFFLSPLQNSINKHLDLDDKHEV